MAEKSERKTKKKPILDIGHKTAGPVTFISTYKESTISQIALTKAHFLDAYSKGKWNLSKVPCPPCFVDVGFMLPPECYNEIIRRHSVAQYVKLKHWQEPQIFKKIAKNIRKHFGVNGLSISLIDKNRAIIKYESTLDMSEIPRVAAVDSHAILSLGYFLLLDASKDWRTSNNPFVKGVPYVKFYLGVPLIDEDNNNIGVLAIFDSFSKTKVEESDLQTLIKYSKEIMNILNKPFETVLEEMNSSPTKKLKSTSPINLELAELKMKLGRATSRGTFMTVFEKDGSGNPYSQNHNFRFSKFLNESSEIDKDFEQQKAEIFNKLYHVGSLKVAASILAKSIATLYSVDFVYILEIRIAEAFTIPSEYFPKNMLEIDAENFKYANKLVKVKGEDSIDLMTRIIGIHGMNNQSLNFENSLHYKAFLSEFGIKYENPKKDTLYNKGLIMPFYRNNSKLVRRKKAKDEVTKKTELYLRSGGYLIATFNQATTNNTFDSEFISKIFEITGMIKKIYIHNK